MKKSVYLLSIILVLFIAAFFAGCGGGGGGGSDASIGEEPTDSIPIMKELVLGPATDTSISLEKPTLISVTSSAPTFKAYIGLDGVMVVSGKNILNQLQGPIDVTNSGCIFSNLDPNKLYVLAVIAENKVGFDSKQIKQSTSGIAPEIKEMETPTTDAYSIRVFKPSFLIAGNPSPSTVAYLGCKGIIKSEGSKVSGYLQSIDMSSLESYDFMGLKPETEYRIIVVASNANGYSTKEVDAKARKSSWRNPASLSDHISKSTTAISNLDLKIDGNGDGVMIWTQRDPNPPYTTTSYYDLMMSEKTGGTWSIPIKIDGHVEWETSSPKLAVNKSGDAVISWEKREELVYDEIKNMYYMSRPMIFMKERRDNKWSAKTQVSFDYDNEEYMDDATNPELSLNDKGNAVIIWTQIDIDHWERIFYSECLNGVWRHPKSLSEKHFDTKDVMSYSVFLDNNDDVTIVNNASDGRDMFTYDIGSPSLTGIEHVSNYSMHFSKSGNNLKFYIREDRPACGEPYRPTTYETEIYEFGIWSDFFPDGLLVPKQEKIALPAVLSNEAGDTLMIWHDKQISETERYFREYRNGKWLPKKVIDYTDSMYIVGYDGLNNNVMLLSVSGESRVCRYNDGKCTGQFGSLPYYSNSKNFIYAINNNGDMSIAWIMADDKMIEQIFISESK